MQMILSLCPEGCYCGPRPSSVPQCLLRNGTPAARTPSSDYRNQTCHIVGYIQWDTNCSTGKMGINVFLECFLLLELLVRQQMIRISLVSLKKTSPQPYDPIFKIIYRVRKKNKQHLIFQIYLQISQKKGKAGGGPDFRSTDFMESRVFSEKVLLFILQLDIQS